MKHIVTEHELTSGAKGLFVHVPGTGVYNIIVRFNSGMHFGDFRRYELPHVMEHLIGCGSKQYPGPNEFKVEVAKNGAYRNAMTSARVNGYVLECAAFECDRIIDLLEEYLTRPIWPEVALPTEISNVAEELRRNLTEYDKVISIAHLERVFPTDYLGYETRIEQLKTIKRDDVINYYNQTHTAANARFYIAGDIPAATAKKLEARLEILFARLPAGQRMRYVEQPAKTLSNPLVMSRAIDQVYYLCEVYGGGLTDQERRAQKLLRVLLFGGFASRVYGQARRQGLAYHIGGMASASAAVSSFGFSGNVSWEHAVPLFELATTELLAMREDGPTQAELQAGIDLIIGSMDRSYQTAADVLGYYLGLYDSEDRIVLLADEQAAIRRLTVADIKAAAAIAAPGAPHGLSVLGAVDGDRAAELEAVVSRLWT